ncbi:MAG: helix-turn-helix domain-containing protein [Methanoregula sp.]|nr:MAG: helix-turn-helix domain-containing protein [Methanoregula sp.]
MNHEPCLLIHCDALVRKMLPSMRAEMVSRLIHVRGLSQSEAARRLGVTRAAISQYVSRKRGSSEVQFSSEISAVIDRWAIAVDTGDSDINICDVCKCAKKKFDRM